MSETDVIFKDLASDLVKEKKAKRRLDTLFKIVFLVYFAPLMIIVCSKLIPFTSDPGEHVALIQIKGVIKDDSPASANNIVGPLRRAFESKSSKAIILSINSPGGSPVQSSYVYKEILRLKSKSDKHVYAVIGDIGASGAYYIASAADTIVADEASLVGSIGVTASGFGFSKLIEKVGVERRTYTSGEHKNFLDPFLDENDAENVHWRSVLDGVHNQFIEAVKNGRKEKLKDDKKLYSGLIWNGEQALELGLVDSFGSVGSVARDLTGFENVIMYDTNKSIIEKLAKALSVQAEHTLNSIVRPNLSY